MGINCILNFFKIFIRGASHDQGTQSVSRAPQNQICCTHLNFGNWSLDILPNIPLEKQTLIHHNFFTNWVFKKIPEYTDFVILQKIMVFFSVLCWKWLHKIFMKLVESLWLCFTLELILYFVQILDIWHLSYKLQGIPNQR